MTDRNSLPTSPAIPKFSARRARCIAGSEERTCAVVVANLTFQASWRWRYSELFERHLVASSCAALFGTRTYCRRVGMALLARWNETSGGSWSMVFSGARAPRVIITDLSENLAVCALHGILGCMGGPAAGVSLHRVPEEDEILALRTWVGSAARFHASSSNTDLRDGWEFFLNWPAALGDESIEGSCLGGLDLCLIDPETEYSGASCFAPADWARISQALSWMPACELSVWINCSRPRDHKVLGWFSAELATRFDGMIDLGGTLPLPDREDWSRFGLAGRVVEASYSIDANRSGSVHLVDPGFLRTWMFQSQFHMIK